MKKSMKNENFACEFGKNSKNFPMKKSMKNENFACEFAREESGTRWSSSYFSRYHENFEKRRFFSGRNHDIQDFIRIPPVGCANTYADAFP